MTARGATRVAGSLNPEDKYAPDSPRIAIPTAEPCRLANADEFARLGLVSAPEVAAQPLRIAPVLPLAGNRR